MPQLFAIQAAEGPFKNHYLGEDREVITYRHARGFISYEDAVHFLTVFSEDVINLFMTTKFNIVIPGIYEANVSLVKQ